MIKLSGEGMLKAEISQEVGLLCQTVGQVVAANGKFLKEMKRVNPVNTQILRKMIQPYCWDGESFSVQIEYQTSHNIPLSQSLIQRKALILFNFMKAERSEDAAEEKFEDSKVWFMRFKAKSQLHNLKVFYKMKQQMVI